MLCLYIIITLHKQNVKFFTLFLNKTINLLNIVLIFNRKFVYTLSFIYIHFKVFIYIIKEDKK